MMSERLLLTFKETEEALSASEGFLRELEDSGELVPLRRGRWVRYYVADLRAWIERHTDPEARAAWLERRYPGLVVFDDGSIGSGGD